MTILQGAILGLVQGLGEFLPISSSGHLMLTRFLLGLEAGDPAYRMLDILLHVGTLLPVLIVFWRDWLEMIRHPIRSGTLGLLFIASLPALAFYVLFDFDFFESGWALGICFLGTAVLLLLTDARRGEGSPKPNVFQALFMGILQGFGLLPGVSRSGSTIFGGVATGVSRKGAARFSFMMSAPAIVGSLLMEGKDALEEGYLREIQLVPTLVGILVACLAGFLAIRFMLRIISRVPMAWFALYLAVIGVVYLVLQLTGSPLLPAFAIPEMAAG